MNMHLFKGTSHVTKLIFRQQRFKMMVWLLSIVSITLAVAYAYPSVYQDEQSKQAFAMTMKNPAMIAMLGPGYEVQDYLMNVGTQFAHEMLLFTAIVVAIMSILLVGNSTREDEEAGRVEVIQSLPVGRLSYLMASLIAVVIVNLLLVILTGVGLVALDIPGIDVKSSFLFGSILGVTGIFFGALTTLFAQVFETSRETIGLSFGVLIVAYLLRAIGDVSNETLSLLSPLGWIGRTDVFVDNNWWPIFLAKAVAIIFIGMACYLNAIRDLGAGFISTRKGRKHASPFLKSTFGLIFTMQRTQFIAWGIGAVILGAAFGAVLGDLETYYADIEFMEAFLPVNVGFSMTEQFIGLLMGIMAIICSIPTVIVVLKLKGEEHKNRTEHFYSRTISRNRVLGSYTLLAVVESIILQLLVVLGLWGAGVTVMDDTLALGTVIGTAIVYLPAMWLIIGMTVVFVGVIPKLSSVVWLYVSFCFIVIYLGALLEFPKWLKDISVFEHIPQFPAEDMTWFSIVVIMIITITLIVVGFIGYNKRDISG